MNQRITGETEAKAVLKGIIRKTQSVGDEILRKRFQQANCNEKKSSKLVKEFFNEELAWYGDFLITEKKFKSYGVGATKHWKSEYIAIEPELIHAENIGCLSKLILGYFDSRKYCKGDVTGIMKFTSQFYFHEHFLIRCIQRFNERSIGQIGVYIYPIIEWLITENVPLTRINDTNYFVCRDFILVTHKLSNSQGLVFKTVLLTDRLTAEHERKFALALENLSESDTESLEVVMTNSIGQVIRKIPAATGKSLLNSLTEKSFWIQFIKTSADIRVCG